MDNENIENTDSNNGEKPIQDLESLDAVALKELVISGRADNVKLSGDNKQLFERAKKGEGFEKQEDGSWLKTEKASTKKESKDEKKEEKSDEEFGLLQKTYLRSADIVDEDEVELAKKLMKETGKDLDVLIESKYFKSELAELRDTKSVTKATSGVEGGGGENKAVDTPEHWIAKGVPPTPDQVPDKKTRVKIARAMMKNASTGGKMFYND